VTSPYNTLPTTQLSPVGSGNEAAPGFTARIYQVDPYLDANGAYTTMATELYYADAFFSGAAGPNVADLSLAVSNNVFIVEGPLNLNADPGNAGAFPDDAPMPGIPGFGSANTTDNIAGEFTTYVEFPSAGVYRMAVNSDDGFRLTVAEERSNYLLEFLAPTAVAGPQAAVLSARGQSGTFGPLPSTPITADVVYGGEACATLPNAAELAGKILLVDRGTCGFLDKARNAQTNGALAMIIINNAANPGFPIVAGGGLEEITIPVVMISYAAGGPIKENLTGLRATIAADSSFLVSEANVGRGAGGAVTDGTHATIYVPEAGLYPFRLLWMEGGGGANVEWYTINAEGQAALLNDRTNENALKTYRVRTAADRPTLSVTRSGQTLTINFTGRLQASPTIDGTFTDVATSSPATIEADGEMRFFRAVQ
jgi:hypothetical protein